MNQTRSKGPEPPLNGQDDPLTFKRQVETRSRYKNARYFRDRRSRNCKWCTVFDTPYHGDMRPFQPLCPHIIKSQDHNIKNPQVITMTITDINK